MARGPSCFRPVGVPPPRRRHFLVPFRRSVARSTRLDFMGRRILCRKALATEMVSRELASYTVLLRSRLCRSHFLTLDNFGFGVSYPELYNSNPDFLAWRCSTDKDQQSIE